MTLPNPVGVGQSGHVDAHNEIAARVNELETKFVAKARDTTDTLQVVTRRTRFQDVAGSPGSLVDIFHYADGSGVANTQTYGVDIHNMDGARTALVIHQYSAVGPAVWLDNTDTAPAIRINNTTNETLNPGGVGSGDYFELQDSARGRGSLRLDRDLVWRNARADTNPMTILGSNGKALSVQNPSNVTCMDVLKQGTGTGHALQVDNYGTGNALFVRQRAGGVGVNITADGGAAGFYPVVVSGQNYGPHFSTIADSGESLTVTKNGTGAGTAVRVVNKGTGDAVEVRNGTARLAAFTAAGHLFVAKGAAPVAVAAGGLLYVDAGGALRYVGAGGTDTLLAAA